MLNDKKNASRLKGKNNFDAKINGIEKVLFFFFQRKQTPTPLLLQFFYLDKPILRETWTKNRKLHKQSKSPISIFHDSRARGHNAIIRRGWWTSWERKRKKPRGMYRFLPRVNKPETRSYHFRWSKNLQARRLPTTGLSITTVLSI